MGGADIGSWLLGNRGAFRANKEEAELVSTLRADREVVEEGLALLGREKIVYKARRGFVVVKRVGSHRNWLTPERTLKDLTQ